MKKLFLFLALSSTFIFSSCSSDDDNGSSSTSVVTARINGVDHRFNTINVNTQPFDTYTDVVITASIDNNPDKRISFIVEQGQPGLDASYYFAYFLNETAHPKIEPFTVNVTKSTSNRLVGTFSGQVQADEAPYEIINIENGAFNIYY